MSTLSEIGPSLPNLARQVLEAYLGGGKVSAMDLDSPIRAPVFVTLHDRHHELRGCIGSLVPTKSNVYEETSYYAVMAATRDPRFAPVTREELDSLEIDVTVLHPLEPIPNESLLDPHRYGVVMRSREGRQGVLLPELPGIDDVETQLHIVRQKAHIAPGTPVELSRFLAERFSENRNAS